MFHKVNTSIPLAWLYKKITKRLSDQVQRHSGCENVESKLRIRIKNDEVEVDNQDLMLHLPELDAMLSLVVRNLRN